MTRLLWRQQLVIVGLRLALMIIGIVLRAGDWLYKALHGTNLILLLMSS